MPQETRLEAVIQAIGQGVKALRDGKADDTAVVHRTGNETINGTKTFGSSPIVPNPSAAAHPVRNDDARNSNARTPVSHAASHGTGGSDPITPPGIGAQPAATALSQIAGLTGLTDGQLLRRVAGAWAAATLGKSDVGLGNVANLAPAELPVSDAAQAALDQKVTATPSGRIASLDVRAPRATGQGPIRMSEDPVRFGLDGAYSAFAGLCRLPTGRLLFIWRQGTDHVNARDGYFRGSYSDDDGRTWSAPWTVLPQQSGGIDLRDVGLAVSRDGTRVYLTYFKGSSSNSALGVFLRTSLDGGTTWSAETRIDPSAPYAAMTGPLVENPDGTLVQCWYGRTGSETRDSVWVARSTNGGTSWSSTRIVNGPSAGRDYQEPWISDCSGTLVMLFRWGNAQDIGVTRSTNGGVTWSTPVVAFTTGTGRPCGVWLSTGALVCIYRRASDGAAMYRASRDLGVTWFAPHILQLITGAGWMAYSAAVEISPGLAFCASSIEQADGAQSVHWFSCVADGPAESPIGDNFPDAVDRTLAGTDQVWAVDNFDRPDSTTGLGDCLTGQPWQYASTAANQQMRIEYGTARCASTDNSPEVAWLECGIADVLIETDLIYGVESGCSVVFRYINATTYLFFTIETSGANIRLYKLVNGTVTQLGVYSAVPAPANAYHRMTVSVKSSAIMCLINGWPAIGYNLSTATNSGGTGFTEQSRFGTSTKHGLRLNESASSGPHRCRRFVVRAC